MELKHFKIIKYSIIVLCIYFTANLSAQTISKLTSFFPKSYGPWIYSDSVKVFNPENLYDYIDGGADSYLSYSFQELLVVNYNRADKKYITIEIYEHQSPLLAFGIYAQERPTKDRFLKIGAQGYQEDGILNFLCSKYYVKISSHDETPETAASMSKMALDLASKLDAKAELPESLNYLPAEGKIENSENLINTNFLGYDFFSSTLVATYKKGDKTFKIFVIPLNSDEEAKQIMLKYMQATKSPFVGKEGIYDVNDPHNGEIKLEWKGNFIWGILNQNQVIVGENYLQMIKDRIDKVQK
jgi:hypothetical protein